MTTDPRCPSGLPLYCLLALATVVPAGCASPPPAKPARPTTRPDDIVCPHCTMNAYAWDSSTSRRGGVVHHDAAVMECPDCVARTAGVWSVVGPTHTCAACAAGVDRCPMCRAADQP